MRTVFKSALLLLALSLPFTVRGQSNETLILHLNEGSRIVGQSVTNRFTLKTSFGRLVIPWGDIDTITFLNTNGSAKVNLADGSQLQGMSTAKRILPAPSSREFFARRLLEGTDPARRRSIE